MKHWDFGDLVAVIAAIAVVWSVLDLFTGGRAVHPLGDSPPRRP